MNRKRSKLQRKYVNAMRQMGDVPWPARRFTYPPTFGNQRNYPTWRLGRLRRMVNRAERVTAEVLEANAALEQAREETKRAVKAARRRERRAKLSPRAIAGRLFNRRSAK